MARKGFITISIRPEDHARLTKRVTYEKKIYDIVTEALDALEKEKVKKQ
ncbi:MAG: hypothetical protein ACRD5B_11140 [Nitrososphaeraceae archaeon]